MLATEQGGVKAPKGGDTLEVRRRHHRKVHWGVYLALLPPMCLLGVFAYYPDISGIYHSFFNWNPGYSSPFVGLKNYITMLHDPLWWSSFEHLGFVLLVMVTLGWALPFLAAELIVSLRSQRLQTVYQTLLIVPLAFPGVVTVLTWEFLYDPNVGAINRFLSGIGLPGLAQNWLGNPSTALGSVIFIGFPFVAGLPFLVILSALKNIPAELFEAAALDGIGRLKRTWHFDIPLLASQIRLLAFLAIIAVVQYGFAAYIVTQGGPGTSTEVPVLSMLGAAFTEDEWGYAATLSTVLFLIMLVLSVAIVATGRERRAARSTMASQ